MQSSELQISDIKQLLDQQIKEATDQNTKKVLTAFKNLIDEKNTDLALAYLSLIPIKTGFLSTKSLGKLYSKQLGMMPINKKTKEFITENKDLYPIKTVEDGALLLRYYEELQRYQRNHPNHWHYEYPKDKGTVKDEAILDWQKDLILSTSLSTAKREEVKLEKTEGETPSKMEREEEQPQEKKTAIKIEIPPSAREFYHSMTMQGEKLSGFEEKQKNPQDIRDEFDSLINRMLAHTKFTGAVREAIKEWFYKNSGQDMENILANLFIHSHFTIASQTHDQHQQEINVESFQELFQISKGAVEESNWSGSAEGIFYEYNYYVYRLQKGIDNVLYMNELGYGENFHTTNGEIFGDKMVELSTQDADPKFSPLPLMKFRVMVQLEVEVKEDNITIKPNVIDLKVFGYTNLIQPQNEYQLSKEQSVKIS